MIQKNNPDCCKLCPAAAITNVGNETGLTPQNENKVDKALSYFSNNFNCSQAVFTSFAVDMGISEDLALKLATGFGGGARCGQICGSVSGALMVLGLKYGHCHADNQEEKTKAYHLTVEFNERFRKKNNSIICSDLLGYNLSISDDMAVIKEKNLFQTVCPKMIADAVEILEQIISEQVAILPDPTTK